MSIDHAKWIKEQLANDPSKNQAGLARHLGLNKSAVSRILSNDRKLSAEEFDNAVIYFGALHPGAAIHPGFSDPGANYSGKPSAKDSGSRSAPIYAASRRPDDFWSVDLGSPIDLRAKPLGHETSQRLLAFYAPDDVMAPRFKTGEIVWVETSRPAGAGDDALLADRRNELNFERVILCEIVALTHDEIIVRQHARGATRRVPYDDWYPHHVLGRQ